MGAVGRATVAIICTVAVAAVVYSCWRFAAGFAQGYSWEEMDWHQRGKTSLVDVWMASEIGKREIQIRGRVCVEFFWLKDGLPVKVICPP